MSLKELLAELKRDYLATFPDKIKLIERLWSERRLEELHTEYHKLKGTGRTYGVPEVTQLGEALELLCEQDTASLTNAVPLSLMVLTRICEARAGGAVLPLDADRDFRVIVEYVIAVKERS